jgi:hypothetical protein
MIGRRLLAADGLFLVAPAAATAVALWLPRREPPALAAVASTRSPIATAAGAAIVAALPVAALLAPYILRNRVDDFIRGVLILPQKRLAFASMAMPSGWWIGAAVVPLGLYLLARRIDSRRTPVNGALWAVAAGLPVAAMWSAAAYQIVWQSVRAAAAVLPIIIVWQLAAGRVESRRQRSIRFGAAAVLAWASLNQFPFAAPIYFSYTMPLVVVAALVAADADADGLRRGPALPLAAMMLAFALLITNRGDLHSLGRFYQPVRLDTELGFPRAHLRVAAGEAAVYRRLSSLITTHYRGGQLIAAPDCPEIYFLAGLESPSGALFDFFSTAAADPRPWLNAEVIIINHEPQFSPAPPPELTAALRRSFVNGEEIGRFEFRWR